MSNEKEQFERFETLFPEWGIFPCNRCPVQKACEEAMSKIHNDKELDNCHTCEETLFHWIMKGEFLN